MNGKNKAGDLWPGIYFIVRIFIAACCFCVPITSIAQLTAGFVADSTSGCAPLIVQFFDQSTGNATNWSWDLGNGITSTSRNPTTFYFEPGKYTIRLTVSNATETNTISREQYITTYGNPKVNFKALTDTITCNPFTAVFQDLSDPVSGTISSLEWDYGDGTFSSDTSMVHRYNFAGEFSVSLKVTNSFGCSKIKGKPSYIQIKEGVKASFGTLDFTFCDPPATVKFTNSSTGKNINQYKWDFGDNGASSVKDPSHTYNQKGRYKVSLIAGNSFGCTDTVKKESAIVIGTGNADFSFKDSSCPNTAITFTNLSAPQSSALVWSFGDGTSSVANNPVKSYTKAGIYKVQLINKYNGCNDTISRQITILETPGANFTTGNDRTVCLPPATVEFYAASQDARSYSWTFGDSATSTLQNASHLFAAEGSYDVSLTVTGTNGCTEKVTKMGLVYIGPPIISGFKNLPLNTCLPATIPFIANIVEPEPTASWLWNFGDGTTSDQQSPTHTYNTPGAYTVSLKVVTVNGCTDSFTLPNAVVLNFRPKANFSASPESGCVLQNINFQNTSQGDFTSWQWDFGDGFTSDDENPSHMYNDTGTYSVSLVVRKDACTDTVKLPGLIRINPPMAKFTNTFDCKDPATGIFKDASIAAETWKWDFGDGSQATEANPVHRFSQSGEYQVSLEVTNGSCMHKYSELVRVINENPKMIAEANDFCRDVSAKFTAGSLNGSLIKSYLWQFGDGTTKQTTEPSVTYFYKLSGNYLPKLTITDLNGCKDSVTSPVTINVFGPKAAFSSAGGNCLGSASVFNDLSKPFGNYPITNWQLDYGDGIVERQTSGPFNHTYASAGTYNFKAIITDSKGCTDSILPLPVIVTNPVADFSVSDSIYCTSKNVTFTSRSSGLGLVHRWNFGDGQGSNLSTVSHSYTSQGSFDIGLVITDKFGCKDSLSKPALVTISNVRAGLKISDTASACPPFKVTLKNQSVNYTSINWDFDDGGFSKLDTPSHYYIVPGTYNLSLIARGFGSCADTVYQKIILKGPAGNFNYDPINICDSGVVRFKAQSSGRTSLIWDFGDGNTMKTMDSVTNYFYNKTGQFKPKLILIDKDGCQVPIVGKDTISIIKVDANIKNVQAFYCDTDSVQFNDSSYAANDIVTKYTWNYGDGIIETTAAAPVHFYTSPGNYQVSLQVETASGCSDSAVLPHIIRIVQSPQINIVASNTVCANDNILFMGEIAATRYFSYIVEMVFRKWKFFGDTEPG